MAPPSDALAAVLAKLEELGKKANQTNSKIEEMQAAMQQISDEQHQVKDWKPQLEDKVSNLQNSVFMLEKKMDLFVHEMPKQKIKSEEEFEIETPTPAHLGVSVKAGASGQIGHREATLYRGAGAGFITTPVPTPVKGANHPTNSFSFTSNGFDNAMNSQAGAYSYAMPQMDFPKFDGSNPKIWIKKCENFFDIYAVLPEHRVKLAVMNFSGSADFWMQSIEMDLRKLVGKLYVK